MAFPMSSSSIFVDGGANLMDESGQGPPKRCGDLEGA